MKHCLLWVGLVVLAVANVSSGQTISNTEDMEVFETKYYTIYTDLGYDVGKEAELRMTALFEEYRDRSKGYSGGIRNKLPFYLCGTMESYRAMGGRPGSVGFFNWDQGILVALADPDDVDYFDLWSTVQHEAFHQFAYYVISKDMPIWLNEGMAGYFQRTQWTGDAFVGNVVTPYDYHWVRKIIDDRDLKSFGEMIRMSRNQWNQEFTYNNYIQVWSMLYFMLSLEDDTYRDGLGKYLNDIDKGLNSEDSFLARVSDDFVELKDEYVEWWNGHEANPGKYKDYEIIVSTLTSFLGRAWSQRQYFDTAEEFFEAAREEDGLKYHRTQWLPPQLLAQALNPPELFTVQQEQVDQIFSAPRTEWKDIYDRLREEAKASAPDAEDLGEWILTRNGRNASLELVLEDGTTLTGTFRVVGGKVSGVEVEIDIAEQADAASQDADEPTDEADSTTTQEPSPRVLTPVTLPVQPAN